MTALRWGTVASFAPREGEEEGEREGGGREREWHQNITMHLEGCLANTAGLATEEQIMSHNSGGLLFFLKLI